MDGSEATKEVVFRSRGTTDLDRVLDDSSEDGTVKIPPTIEDNVSVSSKLGDFVPVDLKMKSEENINCILAYLVDRVRSLEMQIEHQPKSGNPSEISTDEDLEEDNVSVSSKLGDFVPVDQGRWKSSKAADQAQSNLTQTLKDLDISTNEDNWSKWESYFHMLVESLELSTFAFGDTQQAPTTLSELMISLADGNAKEFESKVLPGLYRDVLGRIYHQQFPGVEIINEVEKRRFDAAMVLLFSILTSCTSSRRLEGIMDREGARESRNVGLMFQHLKNHFVQITGTSITQKVMRLVSIARYNPKDKASVKAIEVLRDSRGAFVEQELFFPEIFFVSIFLATLEPNSTVRERLQLMVNEAGKSMELDSVIQVFHSWYRDQEMQQSNDSFTFVKPGKLPRDPKALLLSMEEQKHFKGCSRMGACYQCFKKTGDMSLLWKDCLRHNKNLSKGKKNAD